MLQERERMVESPLSTHLPQIRVVKYTVSLLEKCIRTLSLIFSENTAKLYISLKSQTEMLLKAFGETAQMSY